MSDYVYQEYPKVKYHPKQEARTVQNVEEENALGPGWVNSPKEFPKPKRKQKQNWIQRYYNRHKKKVKVIGSIIGVVSLIGSTYKTWAPYIHEWLTPEFSIEIHKTWNYENSVPPMTTPYRSVKGPCGDDAFDELVYAQVRNNHAHPATLRSISFTVKDWAGWHKGTTIRSQTPLVFIPDRTQCVESATPGEGCYFQVGGNREYRLDSALPRMTLPPGQVVTGFVELRWDSVVDPSRISAYRAATVDVDKETSQVEIEPPTAPSHENDEISVPYDRYPIGWKPDCERITADAER
jgi:hypothetical protein